MTNLDSRFGDMDTDSWVARCTVCEWSMQADDRRAASQALLAHELQPAGLRSLAVHEGVVRRE